MTVPGARRRPSEKAKTAVAFRACNAALPDYLPITTMMGPAGPPTIAPSRSWCLERDSSPDCPWLTILRSGGQFSARPFSGFDFETLAGRGEDDIDQHLANAGIIRHRGKIVSVYNNARRAMELAEQHGSLARYFWAFEPDTAARPDRLDIGFIRDNPTTEVSTRISKDLKKRGWSFVGPTTVYAFMQAMGLVNDHLEGCFCRPKVEAARRGFTRP